MRTLKAVVAIAALFACIALYNLVTMEEPNISRAEKIANVEKQLKEAEKGDLLRMHTLDLYVVSGIKNGQIRLAGAGTRHHSWVPVHQLAPDVDLVIRTRDVQMHTNWKSLFFDQMAGIREPTTQPSTSPAEKKPGASVSGWYAWSRMGLNGQYAATHDTTNMTR